MSAQRKRSYLAVVPAVREKAPAVVPESTPASAASDERLERISVALLHFEIGLSAFSSGLPTDWGYVAYRMAQALTGEDDELEPERARRGGAR